MEYKGMVVVITGASSGIGRDAALEFARRGSTVVGVARREPLLQQLIEQCRSTSPQSSYLCGDRFTAGLWNDLAGSNIHAALITPGPIDTEIWDKDETPSGYTGRKHPARIVTAAIFEAIEKRRHEIIVPKRSPQLIAARWLRFFAPALLRAGMAWMEPVPAEIVRRARARYEKAVPDGARP